MAQEASVDEVVAAAMTPEQAGAQADLLMQTFFAETAQEAVAARGRALALALCSGDPAVMADALLWHHRALLYLGHEIEVGVAIDEARVIAAGLRDDAMLAHCEVCEAVLDEHAHRYVSAIAKLRRAWPRLSSHRDAVRMRGSAAHGLARLCRSLEMFDESIMAAEETARLCGQRGNLAVMWQIRAVALECRLCRAKARYSPLAPIPVDDPDVVEVESTLRDLLAGESSRYFDYGFRALLFDVLIDSGRVAEGVQAWQATSHVQSSHDEPEFRAKVALYIEGPERAIEILTPLLEADAARADGDEQANGLIRWELLAQAYLRMGDHKQAFDALQHVVILTRRSAQRTAQAQAALLSLELDSEREKLQAQRALVHAGKLAAVGKLASSIAHEVSQPSAALMLLGADAHEALRAGRMELLDEVLGDMDRQVVRLGRLVNRMKEFSRDDPLHMERLELRGVVEEAAQLCKPMVAATKVAFTVNVPDLEVHADKERVILSLVNLVNNALDAMREQHDPAPSLRIEAAQREGTPPWIVLSVIDNGPGLSKEALAHMSEPFFTTKSTGLGLGLTITREALSGMHAQLEIANDGERGARLSVLLRPAADPRTPW